MKWSIHPNATVEKDPGTGRIAIHHAGFLSHFTKDEIQNLPDTNVHTDGATGAVTVTHDKTGFRQIFSKQHFAALFKDLDEKDDDVPTEDSAPLITDKSAEDIEKENEANKEETNNLLGVAPEAPAESPAKEETNKESPAPVFSGNPSQL